MHSTDDFVIVEIGNNNEILLTPLESYGMPLLRYQVGDSEEFRKILGGRQVSVGKISRARGRSWKDNDKSKE
jgi:phenylacetate-coenzyme A ligase PaaK-like adenylate-forming protein